MITAKYFKEAEFKRCIPACSLQDMDQKLMDTLDALRAMAEMPLVINSAYRSKEWELKQNRSGNSAHTRGLAVDIRCNDSTRRQKIYDCARALKICRIGIHGSYIHVDIDKSLTQNVTWTY